MAWQAINYLVKKVRRTGALDKKKKSKLEKKKKWQSDGYVRMVQRRTQVAWKH